MRKVRVVLDSNVYISAVLFGRNPEKILELARNGVIEACTSRPIIEEMLGVFKRKYKWSKGQLKELAQEIGEITTLIETQDHIQKIKKDPTDDKFLECAQAAQADAVISGDCHLLELRQFGKTKIITPRDFLEIISSSNGN